MFCAYCGKELPSNVVFCPYCGNKSVIPKDEDNNTRIVEPSYQGQETVNNCNENTTDVMKNPTITGSTYYDSIGSNSENISEKDDPTYAKPFSKTGLFNYHGRRSRLDYFSVGCTTAIIHNTLKKVPVINVIIFVILIYINFTNASKRLHDINKSTTWAIALTILDFISGLIMGVGETLVNNGEPYNTVMTTYGIVIAIVFIPRIILLCIKGTDGPNQYGPDPLAIDKK